MMEYWNDGMMGRDRMTEDSRRSETGDQRVEARRLRPFDRHRAAPGHGSQQHAQRQSIPTVGVAQGDENSVALCPLACILFPNTPVFHSSTIPPFQSSGFLSFPSKLRRLSQFFLDSEELVVFAHPLRPAERAGLDLAGSCCNGKVGNKGVFRLPGAV